MARESIPATAATLVADALKREGGRKGGTREVAVNPLSNAEERERERGRQTILTALCEVACVHNAILSLSLSLSVGGQV